jgi:membrane-bound lytic murein transglycosylase D
VVNESVAVTKEKENGKTDIQQKVISSNAKYHVVKKGEFLAKIATKYGISTNDIVAWNSLETNNLLVGQKLRVNHPDTGNNTKTVAQETNAKGETKAEKDLKLIYYTVKPGDTLWSISMKYDGVTIDQLKEWNKLSGKAGLKVGQKIKVILPAG